MANDADVRRRFQSADARDAYQLLKREADAAGFRFHYKNSAVKAVELVDRDGEKPFSAVAANEHLLFYLRQPVLRRSPGLFDRATGKFGAVKENCRGEYRTRVRNPSEMRTLLDWLREQRAWPRSSAA
ncbi:MAG TPA: hypothetical protein VF605_18925 [Allosphingosinicella sp.]